MRSTYGLTVQALKEAKRRFSEDRVTSNKEATESINRHLQDSVCETIEAERERCAKWCAKLGREAEAKIRMGSPFVEDQQ